MTAFIQELRGVFTRHIQSATPADLIAIASTLCGAQAADGIGAGVEVRPPTSSRFDVVGDIVSDRQTGLIWSRENVPGGRMNWADAKAAASKLTLGGFSDWRLPTVTELLTLVDYERVSPAIDTSAFACESAWYWTSTPYKGSPGDYAWVVDFDDGASYWNYQSCEYFVRAVRAGQLIRNWD